MKFILEFACFQGRKLSRNRLCTVGFTITSGDVTGTGVGIVTALAFPLIMQWNYFMCILLYMIMCMLLSATSTHSKWELMLYCLHCPTLNKVFLLFSFLLLHGMTDPANVRTHKNNLFPYILRLGNFSFQSIDDHWYWFKDIILCLKKWSQIWFQDTLFTIALGEARWSSQKWPSWLSSRTGQVSFLEIK